MLLELNRVVWIAQQYRYSPSCYAKRQGYVILTITISVIYINTSHRRLPTISQSLTKQSLNTRHSTSTTSTTVTIHLGFTITVYEVFQICKCKLISSLYDIFKRWYISDFEFQIYFIYSLYVKVIFFLNEKRNDRIYKTIWKKIK